MAKSFFTDRSGNWRGESKRTTLWWGILAASTALGGLIGSFIPVPVLGTLLGMAVGAYIGSIIHHKVCENALKKEIKPVITDLENYGTVAHASLKGLVAGTRAVVTNSEDPGGAAEHARTSVLNRNWLITTFWKGPARQADKAAKETGDFFKKKFHI